MNTTKRAPKRKGRRRFGAVVAEPNGLFTARWEEAGRRRGRRGFGSRTEADAYLARIRTALADGTREVDAPVTADVTVSAAIEGYEEHRREKGNKAGGLRDTTYRLNTFFPDGAVLLADLTPAKCAAYYQALRTRPQARLLARCMGAAAARAVEHVAGGEGCTCKPFAVDSHRNMLMEARSLLKWCVAKRWLARNPLQGVEGKGKRRHGKPQLRIDEARKWMAKATELADAGEGGAVAAMVALLLGMRAGEIISRVVRDLDDDRRLLWIPDSKTEAGKRTLRVPDILRPYLQRLAEGKAPDALLFGVHWRDWPRECVQRICAAAGVPKVSAHSMRGLHGTLAMEAGVTGAVVAASLGHESITTTMQSYAQPGAAAAAQQQRALTVLSGGKAS